MAGEKIMVVVLLLLVIFLGIIVFLFFIEKRLSSSERKINELEAKSKSSLKLQSKKE